MKILSPYDRLDAIIEGLLSYQLSTEDLEKSGLPSKEITDTQYLIRRSEYKRFQFCPIIKLKNKSFGFRRRIPILKGNFVRDKLKQIDMRLVGISYFSLFCLALIENAKSPIYPKILEFFNISYAEGSWLFIVGSLPGIIITGLTHLWLPKLKISGGKKVFLSYFC